MEDSTDTNTNFKKRKVNTYLDMNDNITQQPTVQSEPTKKSEERFTSTLQNYEREKESSAKDHNAYTRSCVEFLDTLDFDDDELPEETLEYIDAFI